MPDIERAGIEAYCGEWIAHERTDFLIRLWGAGIGRRCFHIVSFQPPAKQAEDT